MKAFWLLLLFGLELYIVFAYCPEKCLCIWYTDNSLTINCSGSDQKEVPYGIDPLVRVLDLSHNDIRAYNHSKYLKSVEKIDLSNNRIAEVCFGGSFKFLECIDLSNNYIKDLRKIGIETLEHLKTLNLSHNSKLRKSSGLKSKSLQNLDLSHCLIFEVDEDFLENLSSIRFVDMSFNFFQSLTNIRSKSLEILDASHGKLESISKFDILNLPDLIKLNISFNPNLTIDFSYDTTCWNVKELDLSYSELTSLDEMFPFCSLEILNASFNKINVIEVRTFFNNCELIFVNLSTNQISEIASRSFFTLDKLKILDLSANQIQDVDFTLYLKVVELDLSKNQISDLSNLVLKFVINLNLSRNNLKNVAVNFNENAPNLKKLNLSFNKIKHLNWVKSKSLSQIDLSYCEISSIDLKAFDGADNMIQINLMGNKLSTLDFRIFKELYNLKDLILSKNQWACHCQSKEFKDLYEFLTVDRPVTDIQSLHCIKNNDTWINNCMDVWFKEKEWKKTIYSLTVSLAIALIVIAVIFFCKYFNDKKQTEETEREARERRENIGNRLSSYRDSTHNLQVTEREEIPYRSSTPPPNYEAALLLPKLTEAQRNLAISSLSISSPRSDNAEQTENNVEAGGDQH